ncbi:hypothetical protein F5Y14DRAFT_448568 [Nemania sp. NC0429]|nr:hypothetical protein F5Y14DRAFT_448568 [Nemania sp. NC0429]
MDLREPEGVLDAVVDGAAQLIFDNAGPVAVQVLHNTGRAVQYVAENAGPAVDQVLHNPGQALKHMVEIAVPVAEQVFRDAHQAAHLAVEHAAPEVNQVLCNTGRAAQHAIGNARPAVEKAVSWAVSKSAVPVSWVVEDPETAFAIGTSMVWVVAPMFVATPILASLGFGADGIIAGSAAAAVQDGISNGAVGSLFATLQSAGTGGYGASTVAGAVQGFGALVAGLSAVEAVMKKMKKKEKET